MRYERQTFVRGQKLTANQMNHIEQGISDLDEHLDELEQNGGGGTGGALSIGTVTDGDNAAASIVDGKLNLTLPRGADGAQGPKGDTGPAGPKGATGARGPTGKDGASVTGLSVEDGVLLVTYGDGEDGGEDPDNGGNGGGSSASSTSLEIGTVTEGEAADASIEDGKLNLVLPRGPQGPQGETGPQGPQGNTGAVGPQGPAGKNGKDGAEGPEGPAGPGFTDAAKGYIVSLFEAASIANMDATLKALKAEWGISDGGGGSGDTAVQSVTLNMDTMPLTVGSKGTLTATVLPSSATDKTVTWSVSPSGYVSLSSTTGTSVVVTAAIAGSCTITATAGGKSASCAVTVTTAAENIPVVGLSLDNTSITTTPGGKFTVTATLTPENTTDTMSWRSTNSSHAFSYWLSNNNRMMHITIDTNYTGTFVLVAQCGTISSMCNVTVSNTVAAAEGETEE